MKIHTKQINNPRSKFIFEFVENNLIKSGINEIDIELGNSVQIMHLGAIRQLQFCFEIKREIEKKFKGEVKCRVIYYYSDGLPILLKNSRGVEYSFNQKSEYIRFGFTSKKIPVKFQKYPNKEDMNLFLSNLRDRLLSNRDLNKNLGKVYIQEKINELNNILSSDYAISEKLNLIDWYRDVNSRLLNLMGIEIPRWEKVSSILDDFEDRKRLLNLIYIIKNKTKKYPIWKFEENKRVRITEEDIKFIFSKINSKIFYPDVILRQCASSLNRAVIRIHGNLYDYQNLVDIFSSALNPSIRIIYNANLKVEEYSKNFKPSIDIINLILADKLEEVKFLFKSKNIIERNVTQWIIQ